MPLRGGTQELFTKFCKGNYAESEQHLGEGCSRSARDSKEFGAFSFLGVFPQFSSDLC